MAIYNLFTNREVSIRQMQPKIHAKSCGKVLFKFKTNPIAG